MLNTEPEFVEGGVPVFKDHADPDLFWYLPTTLELARRDDKGSPVFSFIEYRDPQGAGGGFLSFQVELSLLAKTRVKIEGRLAELSRKPRLTQVPFTEGTVHCVTLDAGAPSGSGSGTGSPPAPVTGMLVNQVLGASKPSLQGNNSAIFTLVLSKDGAEVVMAALKGGQALLGVIYELNYTAMQPPLKVKVTAKMEQVYRYLGAALGGQYKILRADVTAAIERLVADKVITIEKTDTQGTDASAAETDAAVKMFTESLLKDWFTPVLIPGTPRAQPSPTNPGSPQTPYGTGGISLSPFGGTANPINNPFGGSTTGGGTTPNNPFGGSTTGGSTPGGTPPGNPFA